MQFLYKVCQSSADKRPHIFARTSRFKNFFTARRYASAVYAMALCLSVCLSEVGVILKRLNIGLRKQHDSIAEGI